MAEMTAGRFAPQDGSDRNFLLIILCAIWGGVIAGFVPDSLDHFNGQHVPYAAIVHVHAVSYVAWLALLTTQMSLIRSDRVALHMRLGMLGLFMIPWMTIIGPWAFLVMGHLEYGTPDGDAPFLILPVLSVVSFALIAGAGLALRENAAVHKRLMLIGTIVLSDAGFSRWIGPFLGPFLARTLGPGFVAFFVPHFIGACVLMGAILVHDWVWRRRVQPAVAAAVALAVALQVVTTIVYQSPAWKPIAVRLLGH